MENEEKWQASWLHIALGTLTFTDRSGNGVKENIKKTDVRF